MAVKRDFGSFHASNVQELLSMNAKEYTPPSMPFDLPSFKDVQMNGQQFGKKMRENYFLLEKESVFINHGAFGAVLKPALEMAQKWQTYVERQPLRFLDRELLPHLVCVTRRLASFVGCKPNDLVLCSNATTAINSVVRSLCIKPEDTVFVLSISYGAVKKLLKHVCEEAGATYQEEEVPLPLTGPSDIVSVVESRLKVRTKLAVFDFVTSNQGLVVPVKKIIEICHQRNVEVLIDGAHGLGAFDDLPLSPPNGDADYFVTNAHKWFCAPKGCAFMYVNKRHQSKTRCLIISHGFGSGFNSEFIWTGLKDYSPFLALHTVIDFWTAAGVDQMRQYMFNLAKQAAELLVKRWGTQLLAPPEMFGTMVLVQLPPKLWTKQCPLEYHHAEVIQNTLFHDYNIEVPVKLLHNSLYVRISAHIYNVLEEYETLATAVIQLTETS